MMFKVSNDSSREYRGRKGEGKGRVILIALRNRRKRKARIAERDL